MKTSILESSKCEHFANKTKLEKNQGQVKARSQRGIYLMLAILHSTSVKLIMCSTGAMQSKMCIIRNPSPEIFFNSLVPDGGSCRNLTHTMQFYSWLNT